MIKKNAEVQIENEIGAQFLGYNILEYKSPDDKLDIDTFYKTSAYACLYKSYGKIIKFHVEDIINGVLPSPNKKSSTGEKISKETMSDKIKRMLKNEIQQM